MSDWNKTLQSDEYAATLKGGFSRRTAPVIERLNAKLHKHPGHLSVDRALIDDIREAAARLAALQEAIDDIARQRLPSEGTDDDRAVANYEDGYTACVERARAAKGG